MSSPQEAALNVHDISRLFSKYRWMILLCTLCGGALLTLAAQKLPKKYKAHFVLTVYPKYFQSPLIGDFVPGLGESGEMRSQTESLIRQTLTPDYLDALGTRYGIYTSTQTGQAPLSWFQTLRTRLKNICVEYGLYEPGTPESQLSEERQSLRDRIEIFSLNGTTFNVGFLYADPRVTYEITQDLHHQVIQGLLEVRSHTLANIHDAIRNRLATLPVPTTPVAGGSNPPASSGAGTNKPPVQEELRQVREQLRVLSSQYTEEHPLIQQLRDRERTLVRWQKGSATDTIDAATAEGPSAAGEVNRDIYGDLNKKLNYLNIAMDSDRQHEGDYFATLDSPMYPVNPLWPKIPLFAFWGLALGFFGSLFIAPLWEYFDRSALHTNTLSHQLGIPLLGELPAFPSKPPR